MYEVTTTKLFDKRLANLKKYFSLTTNEATEALENIKFSIRQLKENGELPIDYQDHVLKDDPWVGFNEYHVLDDLLVVYYRIDSKNRIRLTTITTHDELRKGKLN